MTKGILKNLSPANLPSGWSFEIEKAIHFPVRPRGSMIPDPDIITRESIYLAGYKKEDPNRAPIFKTRTRILVWIKCIPTDQPGKKNTYIEITKDEAILWLIKNDYLTSEDELEGLFKAYAPPDPIPQFRGTIYDKPRGTGRYYDDPCCK